jgi:4-hydroxybenzoate polyprenyltransferase
MQYLKAIATLIRLPNLVFLLLSQLFIGHVVQTSCANLAALKISATHFLLNAIATTLIAAGGYIINDYFDIKIDEVNKPKRVTIEILFKRRHIMIAHILINILAFAIALYIAIIAGHISYALVHLFCIAILIIYSAYLKRKPFAGNVAVALLTFLSVLMPIIMSRAYIHCGRLLLHNLLFVAGYAFMLTLIREIVKDIEDYKGDEADGCRTLPIVIGINKCKQILYLLSVLTLILIVIHSVVAYYHLHHTWWRSLHLLPIAAGIIAFVLLLNKANKFAHFKALSRLLKVITFWGVIIVLWI